MDFSQNNFYSESHEHVGASTITWAIPVGSKIVHIHFTQSGTASDSTFSCGNGVIARNYGKDQDVETAVTSTTTCQSVKVGNDSSTITAVYSTGPAIATTSIQQLPTATSSNISIDKTVDLYFYGIVLFFILVFFWRNMFTVNKYD